MSKNKNFSKTSEPKKGFKWREDQLEKKPDPKKHADTVQEGQAMTIKEVHERWIKGSPIPRTRNPVYSGEDVGFDSPDLEKVMKMDPVEKAEYIKDVKERLREYEAELDAIEADKKEAELEGQRKAEAGKLADQAAEAKQGTKQAKQQDPAPPA